MHQMPGRYARSVVVFISQHGLPILLAMFQAPELLNGKHQRVGVATVWRSTCTSSTLGIYEASIPSANSFDLKGSATGAQNPTGLRSKAAWSAWKARSKRRKPSRSSASVMMRGGAQCTWGGRKKPNLGGLSREIALVGGVLQLIWAILAHEIAIFKLSMGRAEFSAASELISAHVQLLNKPKPVACSPF